MRAAKLPPSPLHPEGTHPRPAEHGPDAGRYLDAQWERNADASDPLDRLTADVLLPPVKQLNRHEQHLLGFIVEGLAGTLEDLAERDPRLTRDVLERVAAQLQDRADEWHVKALDASRAAREGLGR